MSCPEKVIASEIPAEITAAPEETPTIAGSASGFRNSAWNTAPAVARAAPTTAARSTRGSRSWNRMTSVDVGTPAGRALRRSLHTMRRAEDRGEIHTAPKATPARTDPTSSAPSTRNRVPDRRERISRLSCGEGRRMQVASEVLERLHHAGPGPGDQVRVHQEHVALVHRGDAVESRPLLNGLDGRGRLRGCQIQARRIPDQLDRKS